jgi:hypothetical protein
MARTGKGNFLSDKLDAQPILWSTMKLVKSLTNKLNFDISLLANQPGNDSTYQLINQPTYQLILCI